MILFFFPPNKVILSTIASRIAMDQLSGRGAEMIKKHNHVE